MGVVAEAVVAEAEAEAPKAVRPCGLQLLACFLSPLSPFFFFLYFGFCYFTFYITFHYITLH